MAKQISLASYGGLAGVLRQKRIASAARARERQEAEERKLQREQERVEEEGRMRRHLENLEAARKTQELALKRQQLSEIHKAGQAWIQTEEKFRLEEIKKRAAETKEATRQRELRERVGREAETAKRAQKETALRELRHLTGDILGRETRRTEREEDKAEAALKRERAERAESAKVAKKREAKEGKDRRVRMLKAAAAKGVRFKDKAALRRWLDTGSEADLALAKAYTPKPRTWKGTPKLTGAAALQKKVPPNTQVRLSNLLRGYFPRLQRGDVTIEGAYVELMTQHFPRAKHVPDESKDEAVELYDALAQFVWVSLQAIRDKMGGEEWKAYTPSAAPWKPEPEVIPMQPRGR